MKVHELIKILSDAHPQSEVRLVGNGLNGGGWSYPLKDDIELIQTSYQKTVDIFVKGELKFE